MKTNLRINQPAPEVSDVPDITDDPAAIVSELHGQFVPKELRNMAELYLEKQKVYNSSYKDIGKIFDVFFPEGLTIHGVDEWNRIILLSFIMTKIIRHKHSFNTEVFQFDSLQDISVYAMMLMEIEDGMVDKGTLHRSHAVEE